MVTATEEESALLAVFRGLGTASGDLTSGPCSLLQACSHGVLTGHSPDFYASRPWYRPAKALHQSVRSQKQIPPRSQSCGDGSRLNPRYARILPDFRRVSDPMGAGGVCRA